MSAAAGTGTGGSESGVGDTTGGECSEVHSGTFIASVDPVDTSVLDDVGTIDGGFVVSSTNVGDLAFAGCLHAVTEHISISNNDELTTLAGLERLEAASRLTITGNNALPTLAPIGPIETLEHLWITHNPTLTDLGLDALQSAEEVYLHRNAVLSDLGLDALQSVDKLYFGLGDCGDPPTGPNGRPLEPDSTLPTEINGLPSLVDIGLLHVSGQYSLVSLGRLHEIAAEGGLQGAPLAFYNNAQLPLSEIAALASATGSEPSHCGNLDDEPCEPNCGLGPPP